jgi:hypothetical protein
MSLRWGTGVSTCCANAGGGAEGAGCATGCRRSRERCAGGLGGMKVLGVLLLAGAAGAGGGLAACSDGGHSNTRG